MEGLIPAWGKILRGCTSSLSIAVTPECPRRGHGCQASGNEPLGGDVTLRLLTDNNGQELIDRVVAIVDAKDPIQVSIDGLQPEHDIGRTPATDARFPKHIGAFRIGAIFDAFPRVGRSMRSRREAVA